LPTADSLERSLIAEASKAVTLMGVVSTDLEKILAGLPQSTSRTLRSQLTDAKVRLDGALASLQAELDSPSPDIVSLSLKAKVARRALDIMHIGALAGAIASGGGQVVTVHAAAEGNSAQVELHLDAIEACHIELGELRITQATAADEEANGEPNLQTTDDFSDSGPIGGPSALEEFQAMSDAEGEEYITPFRLVRHDDHYSITLSAGDPYFDLAPSAGLSVGGHAWTAAAETEVRTTLFDIARLIHFDSEADMFAAWSTDRESLLRLGRHLAQLYDDS